APPHGASPLYWNTFSVPLPSASARKRPSGLISNWNGVMLLPPGFVVANPLAVPANVRSMAPLGRKRVVENEPPGIGARVATIVLVEQSPMPVLADLLAPYCTMPPAPKVVSRLPLALRRNSVSALAAQPTTVTAPAAST